MGRHPDWACTGRASAFQRAEACACEAIAQSSAFRNHPRHPNDLRAYDLSDRFSGVHVQFGGDVLPTSFF